MSLRDVSQPVVEVWTSRFYKIDHTKCETVPCKRNVKTATEGSKTSAGWRTGPREA